MLKNQHKTLQDDLSVVLEDLKSEKVSINSNISLTKFKNDLLDHLRLENEKFYPDYLDKQIKKGEDIISTKEFIGQMDVIGKVVVSFLDKYSTPEVINKNVLGFKEELLKIIGDLKTRFKTEEESVLNSYLLL